MKSLLLGEWDGAFGNLEHRVIEKEGVALSSLDCVWLESRNYFYPRYRIGKICLEKNTAHTGLLSQATRAMAG